MTSRFGWDNFLVRLAVALMLVFATYNPQEISYYHWAVVHWKESFSVLKAFVGVVLIILWVIYLRATFRSLGAIGLILAIAFFGTLLWLIIDLGWVSTENVNLLSYLVLIALACVLATGVSWSHIRRRITGQIDVDDADT